VTIPDPEPAVASKVLLLVHVPPAVPSVNVIEAPTHTLSRPVIADGKGLTVKVVVLMQLEGVV
jgi:hypothetical protein